MFLFLLTPYIPTTTIETWLNWHKGGISVLVLHLARLILRERETSLDIIAKVQGKNFQTPQVTSGPDDIFERRYKHISNNSRYDYWLAQSTGNISETRDLTNILRDASIPLWTMNWRSPKQRRFAYGQRIFSTLIRLFYLILYFIF
ncbi:hypothetical protein ACJX0J_036102 [Zea mays]